VSAFLALNNICNIDIGGKNLFCCFATLSFLHVVIINLKDAGSIGRPPGIQQIVFTSADKPLATVSKFE